MKVLHLTLKKKWFDMILSGEKREEYREIKSYWIRRLLYMGFVDPERPFIFSDNEIPYDVLEFRNGYSPNSPSMIVEYKGVEVGNTNEGWSDDYKTEVFILKLGSILSVKNLKSDSIYTN